MWAEWKVWFEPNSVSSKWVWSWKSWPTVRDDLLINSWMFKFAGISDPTMQDRQPWGSWATFKVYKFKKNDEIFFSCQLPHTYKEWTDIRAHIHWTPWDRWTAESWNSVGWKLDYTRANVRSWTFPSSSTIDLQWVCSWTNDKHEVAHWLTSEAILDWDWKKISSMLVCRLYRTDTWADDTWVWTSNANSPALLQFDFHHEIDSNGSRWERIKEW